MNEKSAAPDAVPGNEVDRLLSAMQKINASDLHLKVGSPPLYRIAGTIQRAKMQPLTFERLQLMMEEVLGPDQKVELEKRGAADFAYSVKGFGRFRVNVFRQRGALSFAARRVQTTIPSFEQLHLPDGVRVIPTFEQGLVLVAGITGSGKSTTLASVLQVINETQAVHVVTIENPIEYLYNDAKAFVNQREVGIDVPTFHDGLRSVLRQDPDVILVGEMRDADTIETAMMAAETGHLVFGTIHAANAPQTIGRVLDYFPPDRHHQIRQLLYFNLRAVIVQKLLKGLRPDASRVPAVEIMLVNPLIRKLMAENQDQKIGDVVRSSTAEGMQDFNQSLVTLVRSGMVSEQVAMESSPNPEQLAMNLKGITLGSDRGTIVG
jgi:twitching motility protein PilT